MKKLLNSLLVLTTLAAPTLTVVACNNQLEPANQDYDYDIAVAINKLNYDLNVGLLDTQTNIIKQITPQFIKISLNKKLQDNFNDSKLKVKTITYNGHSLTPQDLSQLGQIKTLLTLDYGVIKVETKLNLNIYDQYQNQVAKAIANADYKYTNDTESTLKDLQATITTNFINDKLDLETQKEFHSNRLIIKEFLKDNKPLVPSDFKVEGTFFITINFQYYDIKSSFILKIILNLSLDNKVSNAITNTIYAKTVDLGISVKQLLDIIDGNFIKSKLSNEIKVGFDISKWTLLNILNDKTKEKLTDSDLLKVNNLDITIKFTYADIQSQTTLELNIQPSYDNDIINKISNITYRLFDAIGDLEKPENLKKTFTANYIASQLSLSDQNKFNKIDYQPTKVEIPDDFKVKLYQIGKLYFTYQGKIGITNVFFASPFFTMNFMTQKNINIKQNITVSTAEQQYLNEVKSNIVGKDATEQRLKDYQLVFDTFNISIFGIGKLNPDGSIGNDLKDEDLKTKGTINCFIGIEINSALSMFPLNLIIN